MEDVVLDVSQDSIWRKKLFEGDYDKKFLITYKEISEIPNYLKDVFEKYQLEFYVSKTCYCPEVFDEDLIIFKFEGKEFPNLVKYSGNNAGVI